MRQRIRQYRDRLATVAATQRHPESPSSAQPEDAAPYPQIDFPSLEPRHVEGARLFASRADLVRSLDVADGGVVAELGVAFGDFSERLIETLRPRTFVAIDLFLLHQVPVVWGRPIDSWLGGSTHVDYYRKRFSAVPGVDVVVIQGDSAASLEQFSEASFDLIYVDAGHSFEEVTRDAEVAKRKIRSDGILVFNDYTMDDHLTGSPYGIVQTVNKLIVEEDWRVLGLALEHDMFCDIAITRRNQRS